MTADAYRLAVAKAQESGLVFAHNPDLGLRPDSAEEFLLFYELGFEWVETRTGLFTKASLENIERLLELAQSDLSARNLLHKHLSRKLAHLVPLSAAESIAAAAFLDDKFPALHVRPGPKQTRHFARDFHIYVLARFIHESFGLSLTRNDSAKVARSACDAIAEGFTLAKCPLTYAAAKTIVFRDDLASRVERYLAIKAARILR